MAEGHRVFETVGKCGYPLFDGEDFRSAAFEVYPYGTAVVLSKGLRPEGVRMGDWRRQVLARANVDVGILPGLDQVDAGLAALTGCLALRGEACWGGDPAEGVIVLPCRRAELPASFRKATAARVSAAMLSKETLMAHKYTNPDAVSKPGAYTHVVEATGGRIVFISGQVALDKDGNVVGAGDLAKQTEQVFQNLQACLAGAGATFADVTKMTTFIVGYQAGRDRAILGAVRQKYLPPENPPASTLIGVYALATPEIMIEIEETAVLP
jgi:enamine deaminase RidA (YjgF/YER057c/UK114 family)